MNRTLTTDSTHLEVSPSAVRSEKARQQFAQLNDPKPCPAQSRRRVSPHGTVFAHLSALLLFSAFASAQTLTGTVKNATTGKPGVGDEVVLLSLGQGMEEAGRTTADAKGNFSFKLDGQGPHLVRVIHQEVTYHRMAPPGTTSVEIEVYDVGKKVDGIEVIADIMRFQARQRNHAGRAHLCRAE